MGQKLGQKEIDAVVDFIEDNLPGGVKDFIDWYSKSDEREQQRLRDRGFSQQQIDTANQERAAYTKTNAATGQLITDVSDATNVARPFVAFAAGVAEARATGKITGKWAQEAMTRQAQRMPANPAYAMTPEQQANINRAFQGMSPDQVAGQARGTLKQFQMNGGQIGGGGTYGVGDAIEDGLTVTSKGGGGAGRPSARRASPELDFRASQYGRKADQQQEVVDQLSRYGGKASPKQPIPNLQDQLRGPAPAANVFGQMRDEVQRLRSVAPRERQLGNSPAANPAVSGRAADYGLDTRSAPLPTGSKQIQVPTNRSAVQPSASPKPDLDEFGDVIDKSDLGRAPQHRDYRTRPEVQPSGVSRAERRSSNPYRGSKGVRDKDAKSPLKGSGETPGTQVKGGNRAEPVKRSTASKQQARATIRSLIRQAKRKGNDEKVARLEERLKNIQ